VRKNRATERTTPWGSFKLREAILAQPLHSFQVREPTLGFPYKVSSGSEIGNELALVKHGGCLRAF
jgi:hypothetical protein